MNQESMSIGGWGLTFIALYLLSLVGVGFWGRMARKDDSLSDFYLGGRGLGFGVLLMTLYATQYSGNTLIGFSGSAYRSGFRFLVCFTFMVTVIGGYLIYAPKLFRLAREQSFLTPGDYLSYRYGWRPVVVLGSLLGIVALSNYILTNLISVGHLTEAISGGAVPFHTGVILLSLIMVIYETLGGMRSVAWTDAVQGVILFAGCAGIFIAVEIQYDGLNAVAQYIAKERPDLWNPPTWEQKRSWLSSLIIVWAGISIYPHAIQRIFAAKSSKALKRSLQIMAFMPLLTSFLMILVGIVGIQQFQNLDRAGSERITILLLLDLVQQIPALKFLFILFIAAAAAAIMSTVDSALLTLSCVFTQDFYRKWKPQVSEGDLTKVGKVFSWTIMAFMAGVALRPPETIWKLVQIKLEFLCQVAPAFFLGVHFANLKAREIFLGMSLGTGVTVLLMILGSEAGSSLVGLSNPIPEKPWGFHTGVWGLAVNLSWIGGSVVVRRWERKP
jgi:solute:Na+ symporter, SSS family